jgi:hypothetical protein
LAYQSGEGLEVISLASIGLYAGLGVMLLIIGYILMQVLFFAVRPFARIRALCRTTVIGALFAVFSFRGCDMDKKANTG